MVALIIQSLDVKDGRDLVIPVMISHDPNKA